MAEEPVATSPAPSPVSTARFMFPRLHDNPFGWGPCEVPEQFRDTPYQPFCKDDRLGKVSKKKMVDCKPCPSDDNHSIVMCVLL